MKRTLLLYVPVLHAGYEHLLASKRFQEGSRIRVLLLGRSFKRRYRSLAKDVRALDPHHAAHYLRYGFPDLDVAVIEDDELARAKDLGLLYVPAEPLLKQIVDDFGLEESFRIKWVDTTFLRWDRSRSTKRFVPVPDVVITVAEAERLLANRAAAVGSGSSDWWRSVGAIAVRDGRILAEAHNRHIPTDYTPYIDGDPRAEFGRGLKADLGTAIHAEAALVADCARQGQALDGADLIVSTFPCPTCAKLIATSGFKRCLYSEGYAILDGLSALRAADVEVIRVDTDPSPASQLHLYTL